MAKNIKRKKGVVVPTFALQKFSSVGRKFKCPSCGKKTFVRFVDVTTGEQVGDEYGRCDREIKCGYFKSPTKEVLKDKPLFTPIEKVKEIYLEPDFINTIDSKYVLKSLSNGRDNFSTFLFNLFGESKRQDVMDILYRYRIGLDNQIWENATVFWQIDSEYDVRTGKIMLYNKDTGKRVKQPFNHISWVHRPDKHSKYGNNTDFSLSQCFFGEHLLSDYPDTDKFHIVESEKTAVLLSIHNPKVMWVATGGLQNINETRLLPFIDKKLVFYPDKGKAYKEWERKLEKYQNGFNIELSDSVEKLDILKDGDDLGDYIVNKYTNNGK